MARPVDIRHAHRRAGKAGAHAGLGRIALACAAAISALLVGSVLAVHRLTRPDPAFAAPAVHAAGHGSEAARAEDGGPAEPARPAPPAAAPVVAAPLVARAAPSRPGAPDPLASAAAVAVSFQMDPRLTKGLHMGDRWVSPSRYTRTLDASGAGLHARARVVDAGGRPLEGEPAWTSAQPEIAGVWPSRGAAVAIVPRREGSTTVTVSAGRAAKRLTVTAARQGSGWRVDVSQ